MPDDKVDRARDLLSRTEYLLDLSLLPVLSEYSQESGLVLLVPSTLDTVLSADPSPELDAVLEEVLGRTRSRRPTADVRDEHRAESVSAVRRAYAGLKGTSRIRIIPDEQPTEEVQRLVQAVVRSRRNDRTARVLDHTYTRASITRQHLTTLLQNSLRTGTAILMRGHSLISKLGKSIPVLEFPRKADDLVAKKQALFGRPFAFRGGRAVRYFVGLLGTVGAPVEPLLGAVGVLMLIVDP